ncbi:hypothetical protein KBD45_00875 [Candidatus Dojkabacteria bacterium]|nr:hypothetical protein [Candidatus Dojkabacteria bacterium]
MNPEKVHAVTEFVCNEMNVGDYTTSGRVASWIKALNRSLPRAQQLPIVDGRSVDFEMSKANCLLPEDIVIPALYVTEPKDTVVKDVYTKIFSPEDTPEKCSGCKLASKCYHWQENQQTEIPQLVQTRISLAQALFGRFARIFRSR